MNYAENFTIFVAVQTTDGFRYIYYTPVDQDNLGSDTYIHHGLGVTAKDGNWHDFVRDLEFDLKEAQPDNNLEAILGFLIRGSGRIDDVKTILVPAPTVVLSAIPSSIISGSSAILSWESTNANNCTIEPDFGSVDCNSTLNVSPTETTAYTITATGSGGISTASASVTVTIPAPTVTISAAPSAIESGSTSILSWSSTNADSCTIEPGIGNVDCNNTISVSPTATTAYTISVTGSGGTTSDSTTITVTVPEPIVSLNGEPSTIESGSTSILSWSSTNADSCTIEPDIGNVDCNSTVSISPIETTVYTIAVTGSGGSASDSTTITVTSPLPTVVDSQKRIQQ